MSSVKSASLKSRLQAGEVLRGMFVPTCDATLCEFISTLGWDFLIADAEHSAIDAKDMENIARACERRGTVPTARVPLSAPAEISRFLDAGARGVMIPFVESAEDARRATSFMKFAPVGRRGLAAPRTAGFGGDGPVQLFVQRENDETLLIAQIESRAGLERLDEIVRVEGVDVIFVGPSDLSLSLGIPQQWDHPTFLHAVDQVADAALRAGKVFGAYFSHPEQLSWYRSLGARLVVTALEDLISVGSKQLR
jgi:2-keto-3-deoxy-L-rhamnonate aldolase RhmA